MALLGVSALRFRLNREIVPTLAPLGKVKHYIEKFVNLEEDVLSKTMASIDQEAPDEDAEGKKADSDEDLDAPIIKLVNLLITEAVHARSFPEHHNTCNV